MQRNATEEQEIEKMALTRKFLSALGIEDDKIDEIVTAHSETVNALKAERDAYKEDAEKLPAVEKELNELKEAHKNDAENVFETRYNELKTEYEDYKAKVQSDEEKRQKSSAYEDLLKDAGVSEKRIKSILKVTNLDDIVLEKDGKIKDASDRKEKIKTEWADFIVKSDEKGADTANPHTKTVKGATMTKEEILAIKDTPTRQKAMAENADLFGISTN